MQQVILLVVNQINVLILSLPKVQRPAAVPALAFTKTKKKKSKIADKKHNMKTYGEWRYSSKYYEHWP